MHKIFEKKIVIFFKTCYNEYRARDLCLVSPHVFSD